MPPGHAIDGQVVQVQLAGLTDVAQHVHDGRARSHLLDGAVPVLVHVAGRALPADRELVVDHGGVRHAEHMHWRRFRRRAGRGAGRGGEQGERGHVRRVALGGGL